MKFYIWSLVIIVLLLAAAALTGCGVSKNQFDKLQADNAYLRQLVIKNQKDQAAAKVASESDKPKSEQATTIVNRTSSVTAPSAVAQANVMSFVYGNPGAFHCFLDWDATGGRASTFVFTSNRGRHWTSLEWDSQPVIVMRPVPGGWMPLSTDRGNTVLPPGKQCYMVVPDSTISSGALYHAVSARGYLPSQFSPDYGLVLLEKPIDEFPIKGDSTTAYLARVRVRVSGSNTRIGSIGLPDRYFERD